MTPSHRYRNPFSIAAQLAKGYTLYRALFHEELRGMQLRGRVLDLGSKSAGAMYYRYLNTEDSSITFSDLNPAPGVLRINVEEPFPVADGTYDMVLSFNLFEHVYGFQNAPAEILRVLKPGGKVIICVPFMHEYHADPDDHFRFTASALSRLWGDFRCVKMASLSYGILTWSLTKVASLVLPRWLYRVAAPVIFLLAAPFDRLVNLRPRVGGLTTPQRFPLGYFCIFEKGST